MAKKNKLTKQIIIALLIAIGSWAIFDLARTLSITLLENGGITNPITQSLILAGGIIVILALLGYGFRGALKKLVK